MATVVETAPSFEDLLKLSEQNGFELIDGRLVEKPMGWESGWVSGRLLTRLSMHCDEGQQGWVAPAEAGYQCFPHRPKLVRKADVSFVRRGRFPNDQVPTGHARIAPDMATEVVSPNDEAEEIMERVSDYLKAGTALVWVIYPRSRIAVVLRADGSATWLDEDQELSGESVIPGFACRLGDVLPPPPAAPATT